MHSYTHNTQCNTYNNVNNKMLFKNQVEEEVSSMLKNSTKNLNVHVQDKNIYMHQFSWHDICVFKENSLISLNLQNANKGIERR